MEIFGNWFVCMCKIANKSEPINYNNQTLGCVPDNVHVS